nr:hypothetical protein [Tanacetum cinerariifolium]
VARAVAAAVAVVEVQLEVVEAGNLQVQARADEPGFDVAFTELVGAGQEHVLDRAEVEVVAAHLGQRQTRAVLAVQRIGA